MNCKSYTISLLRFRIFVLHSNLHSHICIILFLFTRFAPSSSDEDEEEAAVAGGVGKSNGDESDDDDYGDDETKMCNLLVKNLMRILGLMVFHPLLELMLFKQTILNVTTLALILLDLPVIWP